MPTSSTRVRADRHSESTPTDAWCVRIDQPGRAARAFPEHSTAAADALDLERDLREAVRNESFDLRFQPQLDPVTGQMIGVEATVTWQHPTLGVVDPVVFWPIAEATSLIVPIGEWQLWTACLQLQRWADEDDLHLDMCVLVAADQLVAPSFLAMVADILDTTGIDASRLCLELTGSIDLDDREHVELLVQGLRSLGTRVDMCAGDIRFERRSGSLSANGVVATWAARTAST